MSDQLRAAFRTAIQAAVGVVIAFGVAAIGFINNENVDLADDLDVAWKGLAVVGIGLASAVVTFVGNKVQDHFSLGQTPVYTAAEPKPDGAAD